MKLTRYLAFDYLLLFAYIGLPLPVQSFGFPLIIALRRWKILLIILALNSVQSAYIIIGMLPTFLNIQTLQRVEQIMPLPTPPTWISQSIVAVCLPLILGLYIYQVHYLRKKIWPSVKQAFR